MGTSVLSRIVMVISLVLGACVLPGCDFTPKGQVMAVYKKGEAAIASFNAEKFRESLSPECYTYYWETLKLAREGKPDQIRKLGATQMAHVLRLRNRATKEQLTSMNVDEYFVWLIDNGGLVVDKDHGIYPVEVTVTGDTAQMQMGIEVENEPKLGRVGRRGTGMGAAAVRHMLGGNKEVIPLEGLVIAFKKVDGKWFLDHVATDRAFDSVRKLDADDAGQSIAQYVADNEEADAGKIKPNIWDPPFRSK